MGDAVETLCNRIVEICDGYSEPLIRIVAIATDGDWTTNPSHEKLFKTDELMARTKRPSVRFRSCI
jgi:hypothetical protein